MPHKRNADRHRHIPKMSFKGRNWPAYEAGLRRRGGLTLWIEDAALGGWRALGQGLVMSVLTLMACRSQRRVTARSAVGRWRCR